MRVKFPLRDLNLTFILSHLTSTYTYRVTITPMVHGGKKDLKLVRTQRILLEVKD